MTRDITLRSAGTRCILYVGIIMWFLMASRWIEMAIILFLSCVAVRFWSVMNVQSVMNVHCMEEFHPWICTVMKSKMFCFCNLYSRVYIIHVYCTLLFFSFSSTIYKICFGAFLFHWDWRTIAYVPCLFLIGLCKFFKLKLLILFKDHMWRLQLLYPLETL